MLAAGADFIVRTGWTRLRLLDADGAPVAWERIFGDLAVGEVAERAVSVDHSGKGGKSRGDAVFPARLIVLRLAPEAAARAAKAQHRRQNRCRSHRPLQPLTVRATGYLMLVTSLPAEVPRPRCWRRTACVGRWNSAFNGSKPCWASVDCRPRARPSPAAGCSRISSSLC
jgi:hypothetical protein